MLRNKLHDWLKGDWLCIKRMFSLRIQMSIKTSISDHRLIKKREKNKSSLAFYPLYECQGVGLMRFLKYYES